MKIEKKEAVKIGLKLGDMKHGDVFLKENIYYMMTDERNGSAEGCYHGCVNLETGDLDFYPESMTVSPIVCKVVVE